MTSVSASQGVWARRLLGPVGAMALALVGGFVVGGVVTVGPEQPLVLGALAVLVIGVAVLLSPTLAVALLVGVVYTRASDLAETQFGVPSFVIPAAFATAGLMYFRRLLGGDPDRRLVHDETVPALLLVLAWLGVVVVGVVYAVDPDRTWSRVLELVRVLVVFLAVVTSIRRPDAFRAAGWALILSGGFMAAVNVYQFVSGTFDNDYLGLAQAEIAQIVTGEADAPRIGGPLASPNFFALVLVPVVAMAWSRVVSVTESAAGRALAAGCGLLSLVAMVLTFSRGALVGLALIGLILVWRARPSPRQWAMLALIALQRVLSCSPRTTRSVPARCSSSSPVRVRVRSPTRRFGAGPARSPPHGRCSWITRWWAWGRATTRVATRSMPRTSASNRVGSNGSPTAFPSRSRRSTV